MNGSQSLIRSLVAAGVDICFMNPGTSEMHFVHAWTTSPRCEGAGPVRRRRHGRGPTATPASPEGPPRCCCTWGPDWATDLPTCITLVAPAPRWCASSARTPPGMSATTPVAVRYRGRRTHGLGVVHTSGTLRDVADDAMRALEAANRGQIATLVLPADVSWDEGGMLAYPRAVPARPAVADAAVDVAATAAEAGGETLLLLGSTALTEDGLRAASRIAAGTGARLLVETFPARLEEGAGLPAIDRLGYIAEAAQYQLSTVTTLVLVGALAPVSFFAYPGKASDLVPEGCAVVRLADPDQDVVDALNRLADRVAPDAEPMLAGWAPRRGPRCGSRRQQLRGGCRGHAAGERHRRRRGQHVRGHAAPGPGYRPRHSVLTLTGGAIGQGLPVATGAAVAAPDRPVLSCGPTAVRCTPFSRCGPRYARTSTSPP